MLRKSRLKAFTLVETLITLGICCGILLIGTLHLKEYQNHLIFDNTTRKVVAVLDRASRVSTVTGESWIIQVNNVDHYIKLSNNNRQKFEEEKVQLDNNITVHFPGRFLFNGTGHSDPKVITLIGYGIKKEIKYQMQWGRISEEN